MFLDLNLRTKRVDKAQVSTAQGGMAAELEEQGRDPSITKMEAEVLYCLERKCGDLTPGAD